MSLSIIYAVIARNNTIVLADYTEHSGNFPQAVLKVLSVIKKQTLGQIMYSPYTIFYEDIDDITYLIVAEFIKVEVAFSFISDMKKKFQSQYDTLHVKNAFSYYLKAFANEIKPIVRFYEDNQNYIKPNVLCDEYGKNKNILVMKIEDLLMKNDIVDIKSEGVRKVNDNWDNFKVTITNVKRKRRAKVIKMGMLFGMIVLFLFILILMMR
jgi:hypothetical protein